MTRTPMYFKDKASLAISVLALLLSSVSLYFAQFQTSYKVEAVVLEADPLGGNLSYQVAILNQGTHRVIIVDAYLHQDTHDTILVAESPFKDVIRTPALPAVVGAKD